jgi:hypothetical protein
VQRVEGRELLSDCEWAVIGHQDPTGSDTDRTGRGNDLSDEDCRRGAGEARREMVLRHPEPTEAELLRATGELHGDGQRLASMTAGFGAREIKYGQRQGAGIHYC